MEYKIIKKTENLREAVKTANKILKANGKLGLFDGYSNELDFQDNFFDRHGILALVTEDGKVLQVTDCNNHGLYMNELTCGTVLTGGDKHLSIAHHKDNVVTIKHYPEIALTEQVREEARKSKKIIFTS